MRLSSPVLKGFVFLSLLSLTGCNFINDIADNISGDSDVSYSDTGAITSLNRYIDLVNTARDEVDYLEYDLSYLESDINYYYDPGVYEASFSCMFDYEAYDATLHYDTMNPSGLTSTESADLVAKATAVYDVLDELKSLCTDLAKHVTARDYKDDDFAYVNATIDQMYTLMDDYYTKHNELLDTVDALFDVYDTWEVDMSDPVSVGIDNMDKDLELADELLTMIEDNYYAGTSEGVSAQMQTVYDELEAAIAAHQDIETSDYVSYYYSDFYSQLDTTYLPTIKRAMRDFDAADFDAIGYDYDDTLYSYNYLVDDYNYYLDVSGY